MPIKIAKIQALVPRRSDFWRLRCSRAPQRRVRSDWGFSPADRGLNNTCRKILRPVLGCFLSQIVAHRSL